MINIYNYAWNQLLPQQDIFDGNCGFHAMRNANLMINLLYGNNFKDYINDIKKHPIFKKIIDKNYFNFEFNKLKKNRKNLFLTGNEINDILKMNNYHKNIFTVYPKNCYPSFYYENKVKEIIKKKNYQIAFIIFRKRLHIKHWVPIVIDKKGDIVNVHILDSYNMTWWGDPVINLVIKYLYPGKKNILCKNKKILGDIFDLSTKTFKLLFICLALYLFLFELVRRLYT